MNTGLIVKNAFITSIVITCIGAYLKIVHAAGAETFLIIGIIASVIFIVSAIYEVRTSHRIDATEKTLWTIAFIFCSGLAGIVYLAIGRRRVISTSDYKA